MNWLLIINMIFVPINIIFIGIGLYLNYKARNLPFKKMLYAKQLEGFSEVVGTLTDFYNAAQYFIATHGFKLNDKTRVELREKTIREGVNFGKKHMKWAIFLPKELNDRLNDYMKLINGISVSPNIAYQYPENIVYADDPGGLLGEEYKKVFETAIKYLGTEYISKETLKMVDRGKTFAGIKLPIR